MAEKAFLVDTTKCQGCRACQVACKQWNDNPGEKTEFFAGPEFTNPGELSAITWNHVRFYEVDRSNPSRPVWSIRHTKCYHCKEANCLHVCPVKAISKVDGWTVIDQDKCIGCGSCVEACIYKVPHLAEQEYEGYVQIKKDKSYKCHACVKNPREIPACVNACPSGALTYDYRHKVVETAKERLKEYKKIFPNASIYGIDQFGGLNVITILKDKPEQFGLEVAPKPIDMTKVEAIHDLYAILSLFTIGLTSLKRAAFRIARSIVTGGNGFA